jgi:hypothetical protein
MEVAVYVVDFMTGRMVKGFIADPSAPGKYLCNECGKPTGCHEYAVCWEHTPEPFRALRAEREAAQLFDKEFMRDLRICDPSRVASNRVRIEIVMQGAVVRKAREMHALRQRKSLMGERRAISCGEIYLGDLS